MAIAELKSPAVDSKIRTLRLPVARLVFQLFTGKPMQGRFKGWPDVCVVLVAVELLQSQSD
jgi:hypothetical protein